MNEQLTKTEPNPDSLIAVGKHGIVIRSLSDLWRFAEYVIAARMGNATLDSPHKVVLAGQRGLEVGLTLMQAMSNIYVVNNLPTLYGDVVPGLVRAKGNCKYINAEEIGKKPKPGVLLKDWPLNYGFRFTSERLDTKEILSYEYTVADAKQADLWDKPTKSGKKSIWQKHPKRQLRNRCRTFCLRDLYPDALGGMYTYEEMIEVTPEKEPQPELKEKIAVVMQEAGLETKEVTPVDVDIDSSGEELPESGDSVNQPGLFDRQSMETDRKATEKRHSEGVNDE